MLSLVLALVFALLVAVFAIQNSLPVTVAFLAWSFQTSLVLVILGAAIFGALAVVSLAVPMQVRARWDLTKALHRQGELEAEAKTLQERLDRESGKESAEGEGKGGM
ncbi:LapA family protein [Anaeroselena agilis]|uniref:LapA family protein n=1 Tax=Anaeroselena agilis TaxID=3063788 RepID=A0ABU3NW29_9FIRM|nr:LapA family protein [Selenomonadales bacterium 4137-cl]